MTYNVLGGRLNLVQKLLVFTVHFWLQNVLQYCAYSVLSTTLQYFLLYRN